MTNTQEKKQRFLPSLTSVEQLEEIADSLPDDLIAGIVPSGSVMMLAGAPGTGKSFTALSWAAAIAEGGDWFGHAVQQARVVYVLGEGWHKFGRRTKAWSEVNGRRISDDLRFLNGVPLGFDLADPYAVQAFAEEMAEVKPGLIVIDTFSKLARVESENDNAQVAQVMANAEAISEATGATVMLIHHVTKAGGSVRGAGAFTGNCDTVVMAVETLDEDARPDGFMLSTASAHGGKQRDGEETTLRGFSIASPGVLMQSAHNDVGYRKKVDEARERAMAAVAKMAAENAEKQKAEEADNNEEKQEK